jgi:hypothetical protein
VIGIRPEDGRVDGVVVCNGIFETLDNNCTDAFSSTIPIGTIVKRFAVSGSGEKMPTI